MSATDLRRARIEEPITYVCGDSRLTLDPGEVFVEEHAGDVHLHADPTGASPVASVAAVEFNDWLARRQLVFLSWG